MIDIWASKSLVPTLQAGQGHWASQQYQVQVQGQGTRGLLDPLVSSSLYRLDRNTEPASNIRYRYSDRVTGVYSTLWSPAPSTGWTGTLSQPAISGKVQCFRSWSVSRLFWWICFRIQIQILGNNKWNSYAFIEDFRARSETLRIGTGAVLEEPTFWALDVYSTLFACKACSGSHKRRRIFPT